mgnify:CR=1 FL=1|jgi:hypothetical protein
MRHTRLIEAHSEETLRSVQQRSDYDALVTRTREWARDGGVTMTDDELRGALTALQWIYLRSGPQHYDMPVSICHLIGEAGATFLGMNRTRELTESERAQMEALFASLEDGPQTPEPAHNVDAVLGELVNRARTAMANDDLPMADAYLSAILRRAEQMQEALSC